MANETLLKMIVNGLQNLAVDHQTLCEHLNLRALFHGYPDTFAGTPFEPPVPPYPSKDASQTQAADLVARVADYSALLVLYLGGEPASPALFDGKCDEEGLLRLIVDWGTVHSGTQKAILQLYGRQPGPPAGLPNPGAASEERLWAEIVAWFEKIAADSDRLIEVQHMGPGNAQQGNAPPHPLARIEQAVHRATLNTLLIAGRLPYHLYRG